jgi:hypothetical protein
MFERPGHLQTISFTLLNECIKSISSFVKTLVDNSTLWHRQGENARAVIEGNFVEFLETGKDFVGLETMTKVVGAPEDDYPIIFLFCFVTL